MQQIESVTESATPTRPRRKRIMVAVWCLPEEKSVLEANAAQTGLSLSAYLRTVGAGDVPSSTLDQESVLQLAKINGDQGRLGGLLKLYLTNDEKLRRSHDPETLVGMIESLLRRLSEAQDRLLAIARRL